MKNSIKREQSQTGLNSAERENFRLKGKKQNVFIENLQMETQTVFNQNGNINIYPCGFEAGQHIVSGGDRASQKGRMVTEDDGTSHFRAYAKDSGSRYNTLFRTAHGEVKETLEILITDPYGTREYEMFSGGEAFRINFSIRLALSRLLAQRAGSRLQTLVID
ncbi:MAG: hypothetical protein J6T94_04020, partial [Bacteroidaceae bacterium]|nr:hypothetical protein [Bacteroidaceae bacterium]